MEKDEKKQRKEDNNYYYFRDHDQSDNESDEEYYEAPEELIDEFGNTIIQPKEYIPTNEYTELENKENTENVYGVKSLEINLENMMTVDSQLQPLAKSVD